MGMKPNSTPLHNFMWDVVLPFLTDAETKFLLAVLRKTHGWGKANDWITESQLIRQTGNGSKSNSRARAMLADKWLLIEVRDEETKAVYDTPNKRQLAGRQHRRFEYTLTEHCDVHEDEYKHMRKYVDELFDSGDPIKKIKTDGRFALRQFFTERTLPTLGQKIRSASDKKSEGLGQKVRHTKETVTKETEDKNLASSEAEASTDARREAPAADETTFRPICFYKQQLNLDKAEKVARNNTIRHATGTLLEVFADLPGLDALTDQQPFLLFRKSYEQALSYPGSDFDLAWSFCEWAWYKQGKVPLPDKWDGKKISLDRYHQSWLFGNTNWAIVGEWQLLWREWIEEHAGIQASNEVKYEAPPETVLAVMRSSEKVIS